ncbi:helix-turn-helix DNA binding protein [Gordonia phage Mariokart]|nr:helix-turn-helix DNA binding protein [Gordonia phage Mariokart]
MLIERTVELTRAGYTAAQIAEELRITVRSVTRYRNRAGISQPTKRHPPETWERAQRLLADGASYRETAMTVGVDPTHLRLKYPGFGWASGWPDGLTPHDIARNRAS